ncbi:MAG: hypothetical protein QOD03_949 [Verrucomicrobiota bacterium]
MEDAVTNFGGEEKGRSISASAFVMTRARSINTAAHHSRDRSHGHCCDSRDPSRGSCKTAERPGSDDDFRPGCDVAIRTGRDASQTCNDADHYTQLSGAFHRPAAHTPPARAGNRAHRPARDG